MPFLTINSSALVLPFSSFEEEIERRVAAGDTESFLYIVPTGAWSREFLSRLTSLTNRPISTPKILSLQEFIKQLHSRLRPYKRIIADAESAVLIELAMIELFNTHKLEYYDRYESYSHSLPLPRGTFERFCRALIGLKEAGVTPSVLREDVKAEEQKKGKETTELQRAKDMAAVYERYEELLGVEMTDKYGAFIDVAVRIGSMSTQKSAEYTSIQEVFRQAFPDVKDVFVGAFTHFHTPVRKILNSLRDVAALNLYFQVEAEKSNRKLFAAQRSFILSQEEVGFTLVEGRQKSVSDVKDSFSNLLPKIAAGLFERQKNNLSFRKLPADCVKYFSAKDHREEVRRVAESIKQTVISKKNGYHLSETCIAMHNQSDYIKIIEEVFAEYGIPFNSTERKGLDSSSLFSAVDSILKLAEWGLSSHELIKLLQSPYVTVQTQRDDKSNIRLLVRVLNEIHLPRKSSNWSKLLRAEIDQIDKELSIPFVNDDEEEYRRERLESKRNRFEKAEAVLVQIEQQLKLISGHHTPEVFFTNFEKVLHYFAIRDKILHEADVMIEAKSLEMETRSYAALSEVMTTVRGLIAGLGYSNDKLPARFFGERIRAAAMNHRYASRAEPGLGVVVTSFDQVVGLSFDQMYMLGLGNGILPTPYEASIFVMKEHQETGIRNLDRQRYTFYQTMAACRSHLTLSWIAKSVDSERQSCSNFVVALLDLVDAKRLGRSNTNIVYSTQDFLKSTFTRGVFLPDDTVEKICKDVPRFAELVKTRIPNLIKTALTRTQRKQIDGKPTLAVAALSSRSREELEKWRTHVFSVSQLESYASCGFKYFANYILRLKESEEIKEEEGIDALEKGTLLHYRFQLMLERIRNENRNIRTMNYEEFRVMDKYYSNPELFVKDNPGIGHPFWRADIENLLDEDRGVFRKFLEAEQSNKSLTTTPTYFEWSIPPDAQRKSEGYLVTDVTDPDNLQRQFKIRGRIDRIDVDDENKIFAVIDYKSGTTPSATDISNGMSLQLPLYLRIAEDLLRKEYGDEMRGVAALYHRLTGSDSGKTPAIVLSEFADKVYEAKGKRSSGFSKTEEDFHQRLQSAFDFANSYIDGITQASFPLVREDNRGKCKYCSFNRMCRVEEAENYATLRVKSVSNE